MDRAELRRVRHRRDRHHRCQRHASVFVAPDAFGLWLDCDAVPAEEAAALIKPADDALFEIYPVSPEVNRAVNDSEALIVAASASAPAAQEPAPSPAKPKKIKSPDQPTLF